MHVDSLVLFIAHSAHSHSFHCFSLLRVPEKDLKLLCWCWTHCRCCATPGFRGEILTFIELAYRLCRPHPSIKNWRTWWRQSRVLTWFNLVAPNFEIVLGNMKGVRIALKCVTKLLWRPALVLVCTHTHTYSVNVLRGSYHFDCCACLENKVREITQANIMLEYVVYYIYMMCIYIWLWKVPLLNDIIWHLNDHLRWGCLGPLHFMCNFLSATCPQTEANCPCKF